MASCVLLHSEESFWAGDHAAEGKLKDFITSPYHQIEYKGKEPFTVRNYCRLLVTGNPEWIVPVSLEGRRFAVFEIGEDHMKDAAYFAAIDAEMHAGGREALLHHLLTFDLSSVNLREVPKTNALLQQKYASLNPEQGWWLDILNSGRLPYGCDVEGKCAASRLFDHYIERTGKTGARRRSIETMLGIFLGKIAPGLRKVEGSYKNCFGQEETGSVYEFPTLSDCRKAFEKAIQQNENWDGPKDWLPSAETKRDYEYDDKGW
jgi:hypothetical protein